MSNFDLNGADYSANALSLAGLTLLNTVPVNSSRRGYLIQAQDTNGLTVHMDDGTGTGGTVFVLAGPAVQGGAGQSLDMIGVPHTGRIRLYGTGAGVVCAARAW